MRDLIAEALCICRRLRSRAVIGLELLLFDKPEDLEAVGAAETGLTLVDRFRVFCAGVCSDCLSGFDVSSNGTRGRGVLWGDTGLTGPGVA
jgi:hypothetical protein